MHVFLFSNKFTVAEPFEKSRNSQYILQLVCRMFGETDKNLNYENSFFANFDERF